MAWRRVEEKRSEEIIIRSINKDQLGKQEENFDSTFSAVHCTVSGSGRVQYSGMESNRAIWAASGIGGRLEPLATVRTMEIDIESTRLRLDSENKTCPEGRVQTTVD